MKFSAALLLTFLGLSPLDSIACPFSKTGGEVPSDATHQSFLRGRRLQSLSRDDDTRTKLAAIIIKQKRSLQTLDCVSEIELESIRVTLEQMASAIADDGDRGHFLGMIVRLAAVRFSYATTTK
jgi:hypothetical protein